ncbi:MAG TPA: methyltransferase domain-containing protein [Fibrobacteria bacterium]|nr:methyltransferase domain-containing protein [Fibrobacteria bacterium]HOX50808.1 methyltransferase domain-containing protein [Fibrobacteria bacterium]
MPETSKEILREAVEWDRKNWSKAFEFWERRLPEGRPLRCLEIGGRRGGPSLWLASKGHLVVCSDLENPEPIAKPLHEKYGVRGRVEYAALDALSSPSDWMGTFDCVIFKSILGGIARDGKDENRSRVIANIHGLLKPGGLLLFAENLQGSRLHGLFRRRFVRWGASWNYLPFEHVGSLFASFERLEWDTAGFLGAFGRKEWQRELFGRIDRLILDGLVGSRNRYISFGAAWKSR